jgi:CheW-like domain
MSDRATTLRAQFDTSFSLPIGRNDRQLVDVLTMRIEQELCAVLLTEIAQLTANPIVTAVPSASPSLLGLSQARGRVVAAYDLSALRGGARAQPRWLMVPAAEPGIGLVFEHFEGHRKVEAAGACGDTSTSAGRLIPMATLIKAVRAQVPDQPNRSGDTA